MSDSLQRKLVAIVPFVLLGIVVAVVLAVPALRNFFTRESLTSFLERAGWYAPVALALVMALSVVLSPIPNVPIAAVLGLAYGAVAGTAIAVSGALLGAAVAFIIARHYGTGAIRAFTGRRIHFCDGCSEQTLAILVLVARLIPVVSFDVVSYGAGLSRMRFRSFVLCSFFGMIPWTFFYTTVGATVLDRPLLAGVLGVLLAAVILSLPAVIKRYDLFGLRRIVFEQQNEERDPDRLS